MRKLHALLVTSVILLMAPRAFARDHLVPEHSIFSGDEYLGHYDSLVVSVLHEAFERNVTLRFIEQPSFRPESAVGIKQDGGTFIFSVSPKAYLWSYELIRDMESGLLQISNPNIKNAQAAEIAKLRAEVPPDYHDVQLSRCEIAIDEKLATRIGVVWKLMVRETRYPEPDMGPDGKEVTSEAIGLDGDFYHFATQDVSGPIAGEIWSGDEGPKTGKLVALAEIMKVYCASKDRKDLAKLDEILKALEHDLNVP